MILDRHISTGGHIVSLLIEQAPNGWDIRENLDATTVHIEHHEGWHRVERAIRALELKVLRHGVTALASHH